MTSQRGRRARRSIQLALALATTIASFSLGPPRAFSQPTAEDQAAGEKLFNEGRDLIAKGDMATACERFHQSQERDPRLGTLLYLATCHEQTGKTATAYAEFGKALAQAETEKKADRVTQAKEGLARVEPTLSKISVRVTKPAPGQRVRVNGAELTTLDAALPYDPGEILIEADAPGRKSHTQKVTVDKGPTSIEVAIPELADEAARSEDAAAEKDLTLAFVVGGAGIGVTALGFVFGGVALATSSSADEHCQGTFCTQEGLDGHAEADGWAWASNITVGVGLAAVGAGVVLWIVAPTDEADAAPPAVSVVPTVLGTSDGGWIPGIAGAF